MLRLSLPRCTLLVVLVVLVLASSQSMAADDTELNRAIEQHRMGTLTVQAQPGADVRVEQLRHEFWFGAAISSGPFSARANAEQTAKYKQVFLENFNAAVTENALKWHAMERTQGTVDYSIVDAILQWTDENEIPLRGHNIFWGIEEYVQDWQKQLDDDQLREVVKQRAIDIGTRYRGRFAEYDLNNEMIHGNYYETLGPGDHQAHGHVGPARRSGRSTVPERLRYLDRETTGRLCRSHPQVAGSGRTNCRNWRPGTPACRIV